MPHRLDLSLTVYTGRPHAAWLARYLIRAHAIFKPPLRELSLALVGDARMSALHQQFMNIAGPTDVLTFPLEFDGRGRAIAGEVVICVPQAVRQARKGGTTVPKELLLYALHGMLHLCGFDDRTDPAFQKMHRKEDEILTRLGLGPVFSCAPRPERKRGAKANKSNRAANRKRVGA